MKKTVYGIVLFLTSLFFAGCDDDFKGSGLASDAPEVISFGFYREDNPGLLKDYTATISSESPARISLSLPALLERNHLVARFTTHEGNQVLVDGALLTSGVSALDYSMPLDLYVTDGRLYTRYEVNIAKESNIKWQELPSCTDHTLYSQARLCIDPVSQTPYIAFKSRCDGAGESDTHVYVARYSLTDGQWTTLGTSEHIAYSSYLGFAISPAGKPYIAYGNYDQKPYATCVEQVTDNDAWTMVGENLENAQCTYLGLAALSEDCLITSMVGNTSATYYRTNATSIYNGSTWNVGFGPCQSQEVYKVTMAQTSGKAYLAVMDRSSFNVKIYEYSNGQWAELEGYQESVTNSPTMVGVFKLTADLEGNVYMLNADNQSGSYRVKLRKFSAATRQWTTVSGNPTPIAATDRHLYACAAIAPDGTPFIAYGDLQSIGQPLKVIYLDSETRQWSDPMQISDLKVSEDISFVIASNGVGYLSFGDEENMIHIYCTE